MMKKNFIKNKKGIGLAECVVALLLFSIITGSVIAVFSASRNQIRKQNEKHKLDILANNILSVYEASQNFSDFSRMMKNNLSIDVGTPPPQVATVPLGGGSGAGSVPMAVPYEKIVVSGGKADFVDSEGTPVISFNGNYENDKLGETDIPKDTYTGKSSKQMVICGSLKTLLGINLSPHNYICTIKSDEITNEYGIKFQIDPKTNKFQENMFDNIGTWKTYTVDGLSDFEDYLLDSGYYLKLVKQERRQTGTHRVGLITIKDYSKDYYFQVYDATKTGNNTSNVTALTDDNGNNLFYCMTIPENVEDDVIKCSTQIDDSTDGKGNPEKMMFDLSKATVKYASGKTCPANSQFTNELINPKNNSKFTGKWHFLPWVLYRSNANGSRWLDNANETMFCRYYCNNNTYIPNTDDYKSIYYALEDGNTVVLINKNGDWMFSFDSTDKTNPLSDQDNCVFKEIKSTKTYNEKTCNLYYKKGSMPQKQIKKIVFADNVATVYEDKGAPFIRFIYKNGKFEGDTKLIKSDDYKEYFTVSGSTATVKDKYKGDIYFNCEKFDGAYSITTQNEDNDPIFVFNADNFEIIDVVENSEASWGVIGLPYAEEIPSETYFITCGLEGIDRKLIIKVTFTDLAKVKKSENEAFIEPRIYIWSVDGNEVDSDKTDAEKNSPEEIITYFTNIIAGDKVKLEHSYRKG